MPTKTNKRKAVKKVLSPEQKRLKAVLDGEAKLLEKNSVLRYVALLFPKQKNGRVPILSRIAYKIIRLQGGEIGVRYEVLTKK